MKKHFPRFGEEDLQYLNAENPSEQRMITAYRAFLSEGTWSAAAKAAKRSVPVATKILWAAAWKIRARKYSELASEVSILCVRTEYLIDDLPTIIISGFVDSGYPLVIDICSASETKIRGVRNIGNRTIDHVKKFLARNHLSFGMTFDPEFEARIRKVAEEVRERENHET